MIPRSKKPFQRRQFQRAFVDLLDKSGPQIANDASFRRLAAETGRGYIPQRDDPSLSRWIAELRTERIIVAEESQPDSYKLNPDLITGETAVDRFRSLPQEGNESALRRWTGNLLLSAAVIFFFILNFIFLPEAWMKPIIGAASFLAAALGFAGLKFRETKSFFDTGWTTTKLIVTALVTTLLGFALLIGYSNPCTVTGLPGATIKVDGHEAAHIPELTMNTPVPQLWLANDKTQRLFLRWESHEIEVSKKWYVTDDELKAADSERIDFHPEWHDGVKIWWPSGLLLGWTVKSQLVPRFAIKAARPGKLLGALVSTPPPATNIAGDEVPFQDLLESTIPWLEEQLQIQLGQVTGSDEDSPYVIEIHSASTWEKQASTETAFRLHWEKRDAKGQIVRSYQDIVSSKLSVKEGDPPLQAAVAQILVTVLAELGIPEIQAPGLPLTEIKRALLLARKSNAPAEASTAQKTDAAVIALSEATQILAPSASGGSPTPAPAPQSVTTLALKEVLENNVTAAKNALAEKNSAQPERVIQQLTTFATAAADKGQPELASLAKESIGRIQKEAARTQETRVSETAAHAASNITENIKEAQKKLHPRVYIHIAGENQRSGAETLRDKLSDAGFQVPGIQNVAGRGYIPDTIEVRRFQTDSPTQQSAEAILHLVQATFLRSKSRISYVLPDASSDRPGHFEIWLSREAAAPAAAR